jgi:predicted LPLAT superfamily acyltransferase
MQVSSDKYKETTQAWMGRTVGTDWQYNVFYFLIRLGGCRLAYLLLYFVVFYYVLFTPGQRRKTYYYLSRRFPVRNIFKRFADSYRMVLNFGETLIDRAISGIMGSNSLKVKFTDKEKLLELQKDNRGLILMMSHAGCWQVAMHALNILKVPVNLLMHREEGNVDNPYFEQAGLSSMFKIIDPSGYLGGTLEIMEALKNNEVLSVMGDRVIDINQNVCYVEFLGEEAPFHFSTFKIASVTGAPVVILFSNKTGPDSYELGIADIIHVPENLRRSEKIFKPYVERYVKSLEMFTNKHPYQFYNFYDMWNV